MPRTALVTGAVGFVGRHVTPLLRKQGYYVVEIDPRHPDAACDVEQFIRREEKKGYTAWDVILHFAANIEDVNARMNAGILAYQDIVLDYQMSQYIEVNPPRQAVVWMTSCAVDYQDDPYAWVKLTGEKYCQALVKKGIPVKILRPYSGYGSDQALSYPFPAILARAKNQENPLTIWGSGRQIRDFVHIDDLAAACVHAIDNFPTGVPIPIGTGIGTDFRTLAKMIAEEVGYAPKIFADVEKAESSPKRVCESRVAMDYGWKPKVTLLQGIRMALKYDRASR